MAKLRDVFPEYLYTPRLTLQLFDESPEHYQCLLGAMNSPTAHAVMGDFGIHTPAQFDKMLLNERLKGDRWVGGVADDSCFYVVRVGSHSHEGEFAGGVSLAQRYSVTGELIPPDIGWCMLEPHMGKGYATEAAAELLRYAREEANYTEVLVFPDDKNIKSNRVAEKLGFVDGGQVPYADGPGGMMNLLVLPGTRPLKISGVSFGI